MSCSLLKAFLFNRSHYRSANKALFEMGKVKCTCNKSNKLCWKGQRLAARSTLPRRQCCQLETVSLLTCPALPAEMTKIMKGSDHFNSSLSTFIFRSLFIWSWLFSLLNIVFSPLSIVLRGFLLFFMKSRITAYSIRDVNTKEMQTTR